MSKATTPLARFSRDPVLRKALRSSSTHAGDAFAVSAGITPALVAAYGRWLTLEHFLLMEERPHPTPRKEPRLAQIDADFYTKCCNFHFRAGLSGGVIESPVDRYYVAPDMTIVSPPASTRAALVLSAVGCDWRAPC
jgi:hypothetical protein